MRVAPKEAAMHFRFEHDFDIDAKDYWDLFFSEDFTKDLYTKIRMKDFRILEMRDDGKTLKRVVKLTPEKDVPAIFKSVIKDVGYTEHNLFHRDRSEMEVEIEPALMKNKFELRGTYAVKPLGPGRCRRSFEGDVKISIMILGGQIEKYTVDEMRASYEIATQVTREWIAKRKAAV
jgi:hypothetical protein